MLVQYIILEVCFCVYIYKSSADVIYRKVGLLHKLRGGH